MRHASSPWPAKLDHLLALELVDTATDMTKVDPDSTEQATFAVRGRRVPHVFNSHASAVRPQPSVTMHDEMCEVPIFSRVEDKPWGKYLFLS